MRLVRGVVRYVLPVLLVWTLFAWPLPRHCFSGIHSSAHNVEKNRVRTMIPGDHLQLMYNFWLAGDMLAGKTPLFHNPYEFYTGRDSDRVEGGTYFMPFPLVYALGERIAGRAFGWNFTAWLSLLLTYVFTCLLVRRYTRDWWTVTLLSLTALLLPYRWINLCGGSPGGLAMMWVPLLLLGIDRAVREERVSGGVTAGLAAMLTCSSDMHVFFFSVMLMPAWCLIALLAREDFDWRCRGSWLRIGKALLPAVILTGLAGLYLKTATANVMLSTTGPQRGQNEVMLYSPHPAGLLGPARGASAHVYLGWTMTAVLVAGLAGMCLRCLRDWRATWRRALLLAGLWLLIGTVITLALGLRGPFEGKVMKIARDLVPGYGAVRQPAKIYAVLPTLLAVTAALGFSALFPRAGRRRTATACLLAAVCLMTVEYRLRIDPTVCLLDKKQDAYRAIADDARAKGREPAAIAVVLWPGDSHWASLYEHYASLYRVRMVNGYRPFVSKEYNDGVFHRFESINMGELDDGQAEELLRMGVRYLLLHEDAFPEKVSAYPVAFTLRRLLNAPRLSFMKRSGRVWAFRILEAGEQGGKRPQLRFETVFASRHWELEQRSLGGKVVSESGGAFVLLDQPGARTETGITRTVDAEKQRWMVRVRGNGRLVCRARVENRGDHVTRLQVQEPEWTWISVPVPTLKGYPIVSLALEHEQGAIDLDTALLTAGDWNPPAAGNSLELPGLAFFRAGYTDPAANAVVFEADRDPDDEIFYGPLLPLDAGYYHVRLEHFSPAKPGTLLGELVIRVRGAQPSRFQVAAGEPVAAHFVQPHNLPARIGFRFGREADIAIRKVIVSRLNPAPPSADSSLTREPGGD